MAVSADLRATRPALTANQLTAITPPCHARSVSIGNATSGDVMVYTNNDETEYLVVASGYERRIELSHGHFSPSRVAFWLKAAQSGTAVLLWA